MEKRIYSPFDAFAGLWMQLDFSGTWDLAFALAKSES